MRSTGRGAPPPRLLKDPGHFLSLGAGTGLIPFAPGTWGSMLGAALVFALSDLPPGLYWGLVALMAMVGVPLCGRTGLALGQVDHGAIVWDEVVGIMVAAGLAIGIGLPWGSGSAALLPINLLAAFVLFRILDIVKPWPIGLLERSLGGGWGVMADDLAAGLAAGLILVQLNPGRFLGSP